MNGNGWVDCGPRSVLLFTGPDALRYLNGQVTQDVRTVMHQRVCLPACVTDAKGRIQFRVWLSAVGDQAIRVDAMAGCDEALEQRLTRYLIADDVEVVNVSGQQRLWHWIGAIPEEADSQRWGTAGRDCWMPLDQASPPDPTIPVLSGEEWAVWRVRHGIPMEGFEPIEGSFPAELGLERSDVSFHKGCYIGQEVISRIQTAGKVNRRLTVGSVESSFPMGAWRLLDVHGELVGEVTSIAPLEEDGQRHFLAMVRRGKAVAHVSFDGHLAEVSVLNCDGSL